MKTDISESLKIALRPVAVCAAVQSSALNVVAASINRAVEAQLQHEKERIAEIELDNLLAEEFKLRCDQISETVPLSAETVGAMAIDISAHTSEDALNIVRRWDKHGIFIGGKE